MSSLDNIKNTLKDYEFEYNHSDWTKLETSLSNAENKLNQKNISSKVFVGIGLVLVLAAIVSSLFLFSNDGVEIANKELQNNSIENPKENNDETLAKNDAVEEEMLIVAEEKEETETIIVKEKPIVEEEQQKIVSAEIVNIVEQSPEPKNVEQSNIVAETPKKSSEEVEKQDENQHVETPEVSSIRFEYNVETSTCVPCNIDFVAVNVPENCEVIWNLGNGIRQKGNKNSHTLTQSGEYLPEGLVSNNNFILRTDKLDKIVLYAGDSDRIESSNDDNNYHFECEPKDLTGYIWTIDNQEFIGSSVSYKFEKAGIYNIVLLSTNEHFCKTKTEKQINIEIENKYYLPNAFTPENGGINSQFGPIGENMDFEVYNFRIVDSAGILVFESNQVDLMWNGKINNIGTYMWEIKTIDEFGNSQIKKGSVKLLRY